MFKWQKSVNQEMAVSNAFLGKYSSQYIRSSIPLKEQNSKNWNVIS